MIRISSAVYDAIRQTVGHLPPEQGGVLGVRADGNTRLQDAVVTAYYFDRTGESTASSYTPDYASINRILREEWAAEGFLLAGMIHSHSPDCTFPSCGDLHYAGAIMDGAGMTEFLLPIVCVEPFTIYGYRIETEGNVRRAVREDVVCV